MWVSMEGSILAKHDSLKAKAGLLVHVTSTGAKALHVKTLPAQNIKDCRMPSMSTFTIRNVIDLQDPTFEWYPTCDDDSREP